MPWNSFAHNTSIHPKDVLLTNMADYWSIWQSPMCCVYTLLTICLLWLQTKEPQFFVWQRCNGHRSPWAKTHTGEEGCTPCGLLVPQWHPACLTLYFQLQVPHTDVLICLFLVVLTVEWIYCISLRFSTLGRGKLAWLQCQVAAFFRPHFSSP